jgi:hypothetical protein
MNLRFKNYYFDTGYFNSSSDYEEAYKIFSFDYFYYNGYNPLTTLKKCYYEHYLRIEVDIFRVRFYCHFGKNEQVPYEFGLEKYKQSRKKVVK